MSSKMVVKKKPMDATLSDDPEDMNEKDKVSLIKEEYKIAKSACPNYRSEKDEIQGYLVELPHSPDFKDLSSINKLYAIAQSWSSRVTAIEVNAIDNHSRWKRLVNLMDGYIEDKEYRLLGREDIAEMTNMKATAAVKNAVGKERRTLRKFQDKLDESQSFMLMIETKKKDLTSVLTTLGKQVKALSLEQVTHR